MWQAVLAFAGDPEVASDAVAEAFAQALRRGDAIRSPERWLWAWPCGSLSPRFLLRGRSS
jgi:DNA-directed RNA polymerase specialized sigma24 family protein